MKKEDYFVISVESRKGGVGKTTAALNLAKLLLSKNYPILFIDADITGTNIANSLDSLFWRDDTNIIKEDDKPANLLKWFDQKFMCGLNLPEFSEKIDLRKINIIGSQIYEENKTNQDKIKKESLICSPSLLFDELHSFWFIEFLKKISEVFSSKTNTKSIIIIDNSPGFVGIAPSIHQWLTDIGPIRGKFLTVSSLDKQDMISCNHAVIEIYQTFLNKLESAHIFKDAIDNKEITLDTEHKAFFMRLVEEYKKNDKSKSNKSTDLDFYLSSDADKNSEYIKTLYKYQDWIINRVPREVKKGLFRYNTNNLSDIGADFDELLMKIWNYQDDRRGPIPQNRMISYDEYIEYQFLQNMISPSIRYYRRHPRMEKELHYFFDKYEEFNPKEFEEERLDIEKFPSSERYAEKIQQIKNMQQKVENLIDRLYRFGFSNLTRLIQREWQPSYPFNDLRDAFYSLMQDSNFPPFEFMPFRHEPEPFDEKALYMVQEKLYRYLDEYSEIRRSSKEDYLLLKNSFVATLSFLFASTLWREKYFDEILKGLVGLLNIQINKLRSKEGKKYSLQQFLASDEIEEKDFLEYKMEFRPIFFELRHNEYFPYFYKSLCQAQARLIDLHKDTEFLFYVLKQVIMTSKDEFPWMPYIRPILEEVIEKKTLSHEQGKKRCAKGFAEANYMKEFQDILSDVVKKWEITK